MRLRKPCERHGRYEAHIFVVTTQDSPNHLLAQDHYCSGGEFLPEDAIVIEKGSDGWVIPNDAFSAALDAGQRAGAVTLNGLESALFAYFDALSDQVGEPG